MASHHGHSHHQHTTPPQQKRQNERTRALKILFSSDCTTTPLHAQGTSSSSFHSVPLTITRPPFLTTTGGSRRVRGREIRRRRGASTIDRGGSDTNGDPQREALVAQAAQGRQGEPALPRARRGGSDAPDSKVSPALWCVGLGARVASRRRGHGRNSADCGVRPVVLSVLDATILLLCCAVLRCAGCT